MNGPDGSPEQALADERDRAAALVGSLEREIAEIVASAQLANIDDEHDPEGSTVAYERAKAMALLAAATHDLGQAEDALERVAAGTYGRCATCDGAIGIERLEALPATTSCITCAALG